MQCPRQCLSMNLAGQLEGQPFPKLIQVWVCCWFTNFFWALTNTSFASKTPWLSDHETMKPVFESSRWTQVSPSLHSLDKYLHLLSPNVLFLPRFLKHLSAAWYRKVSPSSSRPSPYKSLNLLSHKSLSLVSDCSSMKLARLECWQRKEFLGLVLDY